MSSVIINEGLHSATLQFVIELYYWMRNSSPTISGKKDNGLYRAFTNFCEDLSGYNSLATVTTPRTETFERLLTIEFSR